MVADCTYNLNCGGVSGYTLYILYEMFIILISLEGLQVYMQTDWILQET